MGDIVDYVMDDGLLVKVVYCFAPEGTTITLIQMPQGRERLASPDPSAATP